MCIEALIKIEYKEATKTAHSSHLEKRVNDAITEISRNLEEAKLRAEEMQQSQKVSSEDSDKSPEKEAFDYKKRQQFVKRNTVSDDPNVFYGGDVEDEYISIAEAVEELGAVTIRGLVTDVEVRETKKGKLIVSVSMTDFTDTISVKLFPKKEQLKRFSDGVKSGAYILVTGNAEFDDFDKEITISRVKGIKKTDKFTHERKDRAEIKRVELHAHTKMSDMDGLIDPADLIGTAAAWGHKAVAITDHGVVQGFTPAFHALPKIKSKYPDFKIIYGVEGYLVDDAAKACYNVKEYSFDDTFVVFDIETTGLSFKDNNIIEIGAVKVKGGEVIDRFSTFVNPKEPIPYEITELTSITDEMVIDAPFISEALVNFLEFVNDAVLVAHNANFDVSFIRENCRRLGIEKEFTYVDTLGLSRLLHPHLTKHNLDAVCNEFGLTNEHHHRAVADAEVTAAVFNKFIEKLKDRNISNINQIDDTILTKEEKIERIKKDTSYHIIILAASEIGRINLYRLISMSHLDYFRKAPRIPRTELMAHREGLIIGSACEAGELYRRILDLRNGTCDEARVRETAEFYDYLEIQPLANNEYMLYDEHKEYASVNSWDDLEDINKKIVKLADELGKPCVATCDAHFLNPEDEVYRRILMAGKGFSDADNQAPLYLRTTDEMLQEFEYLGFDKAYEVVVTNTNKISDMIDEIEPVRPDKCPPVIENSDVDLREICYKRAHEQYGEELPTEVYERLEKELNSIISNGFAVMYIIAQKLVHKSNEDGYLVGSRGSVGSSFVATMAGITEVNPLPPHYYCSKCHYADFKSEEVKSFSGMGGCDMPDKVCPVCGEKLKKDGFDIPFETFLGFNGDKEPDIDLNFSGDYQAKAHKYTEVLFGEGHTFKAGTVGTVAEKTAFGYVKAYFEEREIKKSNSEIARIAKGCTDVRRTTGQHPGGIIVLPHGEEIHSFTPIQHPANDETSDIITTHFDYHSIDHNLLKLDILGHDDPTMIRKLQDLTDTDPTLVPLDDAGVMSLFQNTEALGITPDDIGGCKLGCLGIPEFGTDFAMGMLIEAKPKAFTDLVRIAGLSHGTDVWLGNAQDLIRDGIATIATAICTRDDIMTYLIHMGVEPGMSFKIMENVRKGKVATGKCDKWGEWKEEMAKHNVPDWYIASCEKIKYMFPKAHAAAYVMMAWRIAYYKINYPLAYYSAYLSIRAKAFSYEIMCQGPEILHKHMEDFMKRKDSLSNKEADQLSDMRIVEEMYARGYEFHKLDIFKADAQYCKIIDGKIMPHIGSIDGMGEIAANGVYEACKNGPFVSCDDFRERSKVSKTVTDTMKSLGLLGDLPESNQMSIFDFV